MKGRLDDFMTAERRARGDNPAPGIRKMAREFYRGARGTLIIGVAGAARAGKNTVAEHIVETYGRLNGRKVTENVPWDVRQYALADSLKTEVYDWLEAFHAGTTREFLVNSTYPHPEPLDAVKFGWGIAEKASWIDNHKDKLRTVLQRWGTEYRRAQNPEYWIDRVIERIAEEGPRIAVISDIRLDNEPGICHVTINVQRYGDSGIDDVRVGQHISETALKGYRFDYVIGAPAGDTNSLKLQAERVFEEILERFRVQ